MSKEKEIMKELLDFYLDRDTEMESVWIMKKYSITPEEYVRINSKLTKLLKESIER